jgi:hypothetical protein
VTPGERTCNGFGQARVSWYAPSQNRTPWLTPAPAIKTVSATAGTKTTIPLAPIDREAPLGADGYPFLRCSAHPSPPQNGNAACTGPMEEVFDMRKTATIAAVVVLAGLPGCGKTTWT